jgi:uncharacterized protein YukE
MTKRPHTYGSTGPRKPTTIDLDATQVRVEEAVDAAKEGAAAAVSDQLAPAPAVDEAPKDPVAADGVSDTAVMADVAADPGRDQATQVEGTTQAQGAITPAWAARGEEPAPEATATETANDPSPAEAMSATAAADTAQHASTSPADADPKASDSIDPVEDVARPAATETPAVDEPVVAATKPVEPAPAAAASPAPVAAPPRKSSAGAVFAGALGGGILGTAAAYVVATLGFWPAAGPVPADPAALQRIAGLEQELKALAARPTPAAPTGQIDALAASLKALEGQIANLPKPADPTTAVAAVTTRIEALDAAVKAAAERADAATRDLEALRKAIAEAPAGAAGETSPAALTALNQAVAELSTKLEETRQSIGGVSSTVIDGLKADLEAAKTAAATQAEAAKAAADAALKEARDRAAALEAAVKDVAGQAGAAATSQIDDLKKDLGALKGQLETALTGPMADVAKKIDGLANDNANAVTARDQATLAVALGAVKTALDAGRPFATELQTAKALAGTAVDLSALEAVAPTGAKPVAALIEAFPAVARKVLAVVDGAGADAGLIDSLMARAQNLVRIRPVGEVAGTDPASRLARVEARLKAGDVSAALGEWLELPEGARAAGGDFGAQLAARASADAALAKVTSELLATLSKPTQ